MHFLLQLFIYISSLRMADWMKDNRIQPQNGIELDKLKRMTFATIENVIISDFSGKKVRGNMQDSGFLVQTILKEHQGINDVLWQFEVREQTLSVCVSMIDPYNKMAFTSLVPANDVQQIAMSFLCRLNSQMLPCGGFFSSETLSKRRYLLRYSCIIGQISLLLKQISKIAAIINAIAKCAQTGIQKWMKALGMIVKTEANSTETRENRGNIVSNFKQCNPCSKDCGGKITSCLKELYEERRLRRRNPSKYKLINHQNKSVTNYINLLQAGAPQTAFIIEKSNHNLSRAKAIYENLVNSPNISPKIDFFHSSEQLSSSLPILTPITIDFRQPIVVGDEVGEGTYSRVTIQEVTYRLEITIGREVSSEGGTETDQNQEENEDNSCHNSGQSPSNDAPIVIQINKKEKNKFIRGKLAKKQPKQNANQNCVNEVQVQGSSCRLSFQNQKRFLFYLRNQKHPFIANYYCQAQSKLSSQSPFLYMQVYRYCLYSLYLHLPLPTKLALCLQIISCLVFLNSRKILHRDLKMSNIMIDKDMRCRVIDWGSCSGWWKNNSQGDFVAEDDRLKSTSGYFLPYNTVKQMGLSFTSKITKEEYEHSPFFDLYSFGTILKKFFDLDSTVEESHPCKDILGDLKYLAYKCQEWNPQDRLDCKEVQVFLRQIWATLERKKEWIDEP